MQHISTFIISLLLIVMLPLSLFSQESNKTTVKDSIVIKQKYGLRLGGDLGKLVRSFIDDDYKGFEVSADYRLTQNIYLAGELGSEEKITTNDYLDVTSQGSYFKAGADYNLYGNWLDMQNMIYTGLRVGASTFNQKLNSFKVYSTDQYYEVPFTSSELQEFKGLSAIWSELVIGVKAEVLTNLFVGVNAQLKILVTEDKPTNFENLYIPGFNRTFDSGRFGFGFGYNISYMIPIYKKSKTLKTEK